MKHIPNEVWAVVIDQLEIRIEDVSISGAGEWSKTVRDGLAALASLCRTSSLFLRLAQPLLYRHLPSPNKKARGALISTLHEHPYLAQYVETATLKEYFVGRQEFDDLILPYYTEIGSQTRPRCHFLEPWVPRSRCLGNEWGEMDRNVADIWFAHWITLFPNLKRLEYSVPYGNWVLNAMIRSAAGSELESHTSQAVQPHQSTSLATPATMVSYNPLSKLEEVRISCFDEDFPVDLKDCQDLFLLPRLRVFRGYRVRLDTTLARGAPTPDPPLRQSSLQHAYLEQSLAEADGFEDLLRMCPSLKTLRVSWATVGLDDSHLDFGHIGAALRDHGAALEVLDLDCLENFEYEARRTEGEIGNLRGLPRLRHLSAQQDALLRTENGDPVAEGGLESLLPDCLESLSLCSYACRKTAIHTGVRRVLSSRRLVRLKRVQVRYRSRLALRWDLSGWDLSGWRRRKEGPWVVFER